MFPSDSRVVEMETSFFQNSETAMLVRVKTAAFKVWLLWLNSKFGRIPQMVCLQFPWESGQETNIGY
jgi:hypothetical protein